MTRIAVVVGSYPEHEKRRRTDVIRSYGKAGIEVDVLDVTANPYTPGFDGDRAKGVVPEFVAAFRQAEKDGYDAVTPLGILDIGVEEGRQAISIPVVGPLFACLQTARTLGGRLGLIAYSDNLIPGIQARVEHYGAGQVAQAYGSVGLDLTMLADHAHELKDRFCETARRMVREQRIDVVICAGISVCPVHLDRQELADDLDMPVIEAIGAPINLAAAVARMNGRA